jgi:diguanylate cyclase (GGDEF)-like protein/PAS domain S-box-containing protein
MCSLPMMQAVLDLLPDAVFCVDRDKMTLSFVNRAACDSLGYAVEELQGMELRAICPPQDIEALAERLDAVPERGPVTAILRTTQRSKCGQATAAEWHVSRVRQSAAEGEYWIVVARDVSAADRADISRESQAESFGLGLPGHDPLTGLPDRRLFDRRLARGIERLQRQGGYDFAVCFLDLDGFKAVNDDFGHLVGDGVLCEVARRLVACVRPNDMAARYGGDEFTVFLDDLRSEADARSVARRILDRLQAPVTIDGREVNVKASIGVTLSFADCCHAEELLHLADRAMYRAKSLGGGQWAVFDKDD